MSGKVITLKKREAVRRGAPAPWSLGEAFTRDGIDYELVTAGEIRLTELARKQSTKPYSVLDLLSEAGAMVGDHVLVLRPQPSSVGATIRKSVTAAAPSSRTAGSRRGREGR